MDPSPFLEGICRSSGKKSNASYGVRGFTAEHSTVHHSSLSKSETQTNTVTASFYYGTMNLGAAGSSETSVPIHQITRRHIPLDYNLYNTISTQNLIRISISIPHA